MWWRRESSSSSGGGGTGGETLKIGFMGDLTGENSGIVIPPRNGAKLAIDEYNATNPAQKLELVEYDSQGSADQAVPLVTQAIQQDKIVGLIGPAFSGESKAAGPVLEQGGIPSISPSATNPGLAQNGWKFWHRVVANDADQGPAIADFLIRAKSPQKAFVISDDQEYSVGLADAMFAALPGQGRHRRARPVRAGRLGLLLHRGQGQRLPAGRDRLRRLLRAGRPAAQAAARRRRDRDVRLRRRLARPAADPGCRGAGRRGCGPGLPVQHPVRRHVPARWPTSPTKYKAAFNTDPAIYSTEGYDAATLFINAIKGGATTPDAINTAVSRRHAGRRVQEDHVQAER